MLVFFLLDLVGERLDLWFLGPDSASPDRSVPFLEEGGGRVVEVLIRWIRGFYGLGIVKEMGVRMFVG